MLIKLFLCVSEPLYGLPEWRSDTVAVAPKPKPEVIVEALPQPTKPSDVKVKDNLPPIANRQAWFTAFQCEKTTKNSQTKKAPKPTPKRRTILKSKKVRTISKAEKAEKYQTNNLVLQTILGEGYGLSSCCIKRHREDDEVVSLQKKRHH